MKKYSDYISVLTNTPSLSKSYLNKLYKQGGSGGGLGDLGDQKKVLSKRLQNYIEMFKEQKLLILGGGNGGNFITNTKSNQFSSLFIDSFFESGNIERVYKHQNKQEYDLYINADSNTKGYQQWFYFRIRNTRKDVKYTFNIKNFTKSQSLYKKGMKILWRSKLNNLKKLNQPNINLQEMDEWEAIPEKNLVDISYSKTNIEKTPNERGLYKKYFKEDSFTTNLDKKKNKFEKQQTNIQITGSKKYYNQLSFQLQFDNNNDTVYLAYSRPYTYSQIVSDIVKVEQQLKNCSSSNNFVNLNSGGGVQKFNEDVQFQYNNSFTYKRELLCITLGGLPVPVITVTALAGHLPLNKREVIIMTARVHPGESNGSFVFNGFFNFITSAQFSQNWYQQQFLREQFIFKLIPCLNPDGVVCGNYRTGLAGVDLNRQWICPHKQLHPTIFATKMLMENIISKGYGEVGNGKILLYCDMHGHSRKKNSFIYGCNTAAEGGFNSWTKVRLFPRILAKLSPAFSLRDCTFKVQKHKLGTARVVVWKEFKVTNSFTLENSFFGFDYAGSEVTTEFTAQLYRELGIEIGKSLWEYKKICKEIQKELNITRGWLKPKLLLQVTGIPAAERAKKIIEENKNKELKQSPYQILQTNQNEQQQQNMSSKMGRVEQSKYYQEVARPKSQMINKFQSQAQLEAGATLDLNLIERNVVKIQKFWRLKSMKKNFDRDCYTTEFTQTMQDDSNAIGQDNTISTIQVMKDDDDDEEEGYSPSSILKQDDSFQIQQESQKLKLDWRQYFTVEELESAYNKILQGKDPNYEEQEGGGLGGGGGESGSDSCPSDDNLKIEELYCVIYMRKKLRDIELKVKIEQEQKYLQEFAKYLNKQIKQFQKKGIKQLDNTSLDSGGGAGSLERSPIKLKEKDIIRSNSKNVNEEKRNKNLTYNLIKQNRSFERQNVKNETQNTIKSDDGDVGVLSLKKMNKQVTQDKEAKTTKNQSQIKYDQYKNNKNKSFINNNNNTNENLKHLLVSQESDLKDESISNILERSYLLQETNQTIDSQSNDLSSINQQKNLIKKEAIKFAQVNMNLATMNQEQKTQRKLVIKSNQGALLKSQLDQQRRMRSLESERNNLVTEGGENQDMINDYISHNQNKKRSLENESQNYMSRRKSQQQQQSMIALNSNANQNSHQNISQSSNNQNSQIIYMQNQYPMLPFLNMQGNNISKLQQQQQSQQQLNSSEQKILTNQNKTKQQQQTQKSNAVPLNRPQTSHNLQQQQDKSKAGTKLFLKGFMESNLEKQNFQNKMNSEQKKTYVGEAIEKKMSQLERSVMTVQKNRNELKGNGNALVQEKNTFTNRNLLKSSSPSQNLQSQQQMHSTRNNDQQQKFSQIKIRQERSQEKEIGIGNKINVNHNISVQNFAMPIQQQSNQQQLENLKQNIQKKNIPFQKFKQTNTNQQQTNQEEQIKQNMSLLGFNSRPLQSTSNQKSQQQQQQVISSTNKQFQQRKSFEINQNLNSQQEAKSQFEQDGAKTLRQQQAKNQLKQKRIIGSQSPQHMDSSFSSFNLNKQSPVAAFQDLSKLLPQEKQKQVILNQNDKKLSGHYGKLSVENSAIQGLIDKYGMVNQQNNPTSNKNEKYEKVTLRSKDKKGSIERKLNGEINYDDEEKLNQEEMSEIKSICNDIISKRRIYKQ